MRQLFLTAVILAACSATPQDLSGKMVTFPLESNSSFMRLSTSRDSFTLVSVCLRFFTDLSRSHALFSIATPSMANAFLIFKDTLEGRIDLHVMDKMSRHDGHDYQRNTWNTICATWESDGGLAQLWLNGKPGARKFTQSGTISGAPIILLGQEQDAYGTKFDIKQSFVGMISDVHMWDYVLSDCEIDRYTSDLNFTPGNVINWRALEYQTTGKVLVEEKKQRCEENYLYRGYG